MEITSSIDPCEFVEEEYEPNPGTVNFSSSSIEDLFGSGSENELMVLRGKSFFPHRVFLFGFSYPAVSISCCYCSTCMWFLLAVGVRPKETKINLMDCICLCSEVKMYYFRSYILCVRRF